jgi:hypothetical protein
MSVDRLAAHHVAAPKRAAAVVAVWPAMNAMWAKRALIGSGSRG